MWHTSTECQRCQLWHNLRDRFVALLFVAGQSNVGTVGTDLSDVTCDRFAGNERRAINPSQATRNWE